MLIAPRGTEEPEIVQPRDAVTKAGATVTVVGLNSGEGLTVNNDLDSAVTYSVDNTIEKNVSAAGSIIARGRTAGWPPTTAR